jgi:hypothetical protein
VAIDTIDDVLSHYGVRGMRWGVRKRSSKSGTSSETDSVAVKVAGGRAPEPVLVKTKAGSPIQTSGGRYHPPSEEAKRAAAIKQLASKSGTHSLTNNEMRALIDRMNLESQYAKLNPKQKSKAEKFIRGIMKTPIPAMTFEGVKKKYSGSGSKEAQAGLQFAELLLRNHPGQRKFMSGKEKP